MEDVESSLLISTHKSVLKEMVMWKNGDTKSPLYRHREHLTVKCDAILEVVGDDMEYIYIYLVK